ncbi:MAG: hypothetical protein WBG50_04705 [Desulfomonilaceae bacterium]
MRNSFRLLCLSKIVKQSTFTLAILFPLLGAISLAAVANLDPEQIKSSATTRLEEIIQGISEGDFTLYSSHFSRAMKEAQTRESFLNLQRRLQKAVGKFQSLQYIGFYRRSGNLVTLFKARFSKEKDDVLITLVLERSGPDPKVTGLWFDSPALEQ